LATIIWLELISMVMFSIAVGVVVSCAVEGCELRVGCQCGQQAADAAAALAAFSQVIPRV